MILVKLAIMTWHYTFNFTTSYSFSVMLFFFFIQMGSTYGHKMMKGYLSMKGTHAAEERIGSILRDVNLPYHEARSLV